MSLSNPSSSPQSRPLDVQRQDASNHDSSSSNTRRVSDTGSLPPSNLDRLDPDSILADEADPDTLFNADSESEYGGSRRSSVAHTTHVSKMASQSHTNGDAAAQSATMTPTQSTHDIAAIADPNNNTKTPGPATSSISEIRTLRTQVEDLTNQVTGLNGKLVNSFMRISDLEDDLSDAKERVMTGSTRVAELEKERQEHLAALNTGLLVEKAHVSTEMQRMMDRVIEETKQRGQAESDKAKIESELDELSASLFNEANRMVAVEKLARARAEDKSRQMEERLQDTEGIMLEQQKVLADLQKQLDAYKAGDVPSTPQSTHSSRLGDTDAQVTPLSPARPTMPRSASHMTISRRPSIGPASFDQRQVMLDVVPYQELRSFLNHLRKLRKQLSPFYNYPYDPKRGPPAHKHTVSADSPVQPQRPSSPAVSQTLQSATSMSSYGMSTDYNGYVHSNPFVIAGISRHKDYPTLPANCEQLVHLPSQSSLPFIKRAQEEDSDPCLRLDFAPGFNWLSRRTANTAILEGNLVIEPVFAGGVVEDEDAVRAEHAHLPPAACAMCGMLVVNVPLPGGEDASKSSGGPDLRSVTSWASSMAAATGSAANSLREAASGTPSSSSPGLTSTGDAAEKPQLKSNRSGLFSSFASLRNMTGSPKPAKDATPTTPVTESHASSDDPSHQGGSPQLGQPPTPTTPAISGKAYPTQGPLPVPTHIFRLSDTATARYLLCPHHCLTRLRAACAFWGYLRNIERAVVLEGKLAWDDEQQQPPQSAQSLTRNATIKPLPKLAKPVVEEGAEEDADDAVTPSTENATAVTEASQALKSVVEQSDDDKGEGDSVAVAEGQEKVSEESQEQRSEETKEQTSEEGKEEGSEGEAKQLDSPAKVVGTIEDADADATKDATLAKDGEEDKDASSAAHNKDGSDESDSHASVDEDGFQDAQSHATSPNVETKSLPDTDEQSPQTPSTSQPAEEAGTAADAQTPHAEKSEFVQATGNTSTGTTTTTTGLPPVPPRRQHRPVPAIPTGSANANGNGSGTPPPVPPRSSVDAPNAVAAPPPSRKRLPFDDAADTTGITWEEKVYLEVMRLKRDMWEARAGIVD